MTKQEQLLASLLAHINENVLMNEDETVEEVHVEADDFSTILSIIHGKKEKESETEHVVEFEDEDDYEDELEYDYEDEEDVNKNYGSKA